MIWQRFAAVLAFVGWGLFISGRLPGVLIRCSLRDLVVFQQIQCQLIHAL